MALQSSGQISLQDIEDEFGDLGTAGQIAINEYYGVDVGVPSSGQIGLADFYDATNINIIWSTTTFISSATEPSGLAVAGVRLFADGSSEDMAGNGVPGDWLDSVATGNGDIFESRMVVNSGSPIGQTTWTTLDANLAFSIARSSEGTSNANIDLTIRRINEPSTEVTRTIVMSATISDGGGGPF